MDIYFTNTLSVPIILLSALLALFISRLQYWNNTEDILGKKQKLALTLIRFAAFFLIALLLSGIALAHIKKRKIKPAVIVAVDNSESLKPYKESTDSIVNHLSSLFPEENLHFWQFGHAPSRKINLNFTEKESNYGNLFDELTQNYLPTDISAVLLLGDGIFNKGIDPVFKSKTFPFPVYSIGIGDTTTVIDAAIVNVNHNQTAFLDSYFPVEVGIDFSLARGNQVKLEVFKDETLEYSLDINVSSDHQFNNELINLKSGTAGINNYKLHVSELEDEKNLSNNSYEFSISVISEKQNILLLGNGPHPDLAAINNALKANQNYSIDLVSGIGNNVAPDKYDLVVLHQIPDKSKKSLELVKKIIQAKQPVLFIVGEKSSIPYLNMVQQNMNISNSNVFENTGAVINENFDLFKPEHGTEHAIKSFPPLFSPFGNTSFKNGFQAIAFQLIKNIKTDNPIIAVGAGNRHRQGFILGEGIWRWRIYDYISNGSHEVFDKLIQSMINYLITKQDEDIFNVYHQDTFDENEEIIIHANLYNASNELINYPEVEIEFLAEDSTAYSYTFDKYDNQYRLNVGKLPAGAYSYKAKTTLSNNQIVKSGIININTSQIELLNTKANFQVLNQIAKNTGGRFYASNEIDQLFVDIKENKTFKSKKIQEFAYKNIFDLKWLFTFIVFLLAMEWFLRKLWGTY